LTRLSARLARMQRRAYRSSQSQRSGNAVFGRHHSSVLAGQLSAKTYCTMLHTTSWKLSVTFTSLCGGRLADVRLPKQDWHNPHGQLFLVVDPIRFGGIAAPANASCSPRSLPALLRPARGVKLSASPSSAGQNQIGSTRLTLEADYAVPL
jgi:hypothetical protein